jgi:hypothetical protein
MSVVDFVGRNYEEMDSAKNITVTAMFAETLDDSQHSTLYITRLPRGKFLFLVTPLQFVDWIGEVRFH